MRIESLRATFQIASGLALVIIGLIGLIMPVMPGWVFLIPGLVILSRHFHWAKRLLQWGREKMEGRRAGP